MSPDWGAETIRPDQFGLEQVSRGNSLIVKAPGMEIPRHLIQIVKQKDDFLVTNSLQDQHGAVSVIKEFDRAYRQGSPNQREAFKNRLRGPTNICVIIRPRALNWLIETSKIDFSSAMLELFDDVFFLEYDTTRERHRRAAIKKGVDLSTDPDRADGRGLSEHDLNHQIDRLTYEYEFSAEPLSAVRRKYGETFVPELVEDISLSNADKGLLPEGIATAFRDLAMGELSGRFVDSSKEIAAKILKNGPGAIGPLITGLAPSAAAALLLWAYLRRDQSKMSGDEILDLLAGTGTTPTARAELEARLDLPPRTLDDLHWLIREGQISKIRQACRQSPAETEAFVREVEDYAERLDSLESALERINDEVETFVGLYSEHLREATQDLSYLANQLASDEAALLDPLVDRDEIAIEEIPYFARGQAETGGDEEVSAAPPNKLKHIVDASRNGGLVILKGTHGTGKTTAAYRAGRMLSAEEYAVRIPNLSRHSPGFVRQALERSVDADNLILIVSYRTGTGPAQINGTDIETIVGWLREGVCDSIIIECRSEFFRSFTARYGDTTTLEPNIKSVIEFEPFDAHRQAVGIVFWVSEYVGADPPEKDRVMELLRLSEGNPEVLKIATRFELSEDHSLTGINSGSDLVQSDIQTLLNRQGGSREWYERLFVLLAVTGGLRTAEICDLLETEPSDLIREARPIRNYLSRGVAEVLAEETTMPRDGEESALIWRLSPDIYASTIFSQCLEPETSYDFWWVYRRLFVDDRNQSYDDRLPALSRNLSRIHLSARREEDTETVRRCVQTANKLVSKALTEQIDTEQVIRSFLALSIGEVPANPQPVTANMDAVVDALCETANVESSDGTTPSAVLKRYYTSLFANLMEATDPNEDDITWLEEVEQHLWKATQDERIAATEYSLFKHVYGISLSEATRRSVSSGSSSKHETCENGAAELLTWVDIIEEHARETAVESTHDADSTYFLEELYAVTLSDLISSSDGEKRERCLYAIEKCIQDAATDPLVSNETPVFLSNIYSLTLQNLARWAPPQEASQWFDIIEEQFQAVASEISIPEEQFLAQTYGWMMAYITDLSSTPRVEEWISSIEDRAWAAATEEYSQDTGTILTEVYGAAISFLSTRFDPNDDDVAQWLIIFNEGIDVCAIHGPHEQDPTQFRVEAYAVALCKMMDERTDVSKEWYDRFLTHILDGESSEFAARFYSEYYTMVSRLLEITDWLAWITEDMLSRSGLVNDSDKTQDWGIEVASRVIAEAVLRARIDSAIGDGGLDTETGRELMQTVATVWSHSETAFESLVMRVVSRLQNGALDDGLVEYAPTGRREESAPAFVGHVSAYTLVNAYQTDGKAGFSEAHDRAVHIAQEMNDTRACLIVFYSRTIVCALAYGVSDTSDIIEQLLERATKNIESVVILAEVGAILENDRLWGSVSR